MEQKEEKQKALVWKKELILSLFKRQRILRILLGVALLAGVALLVWVYLSGSSLHHRNEQATTWVETPCEIDYVERVGLSTNTSNRYQVRYHYSYDGSDYHSSRYSIPRSFELVKWKRSSGVTYGSSHYTEDQKSLCYVNPTSPEEAVLAQSSLAIGDYVSHLLWLAVIFLLYLSVPSFVYKTCRVNQKQLRELITGQKENILEEMDRLSEPLDDETQGLIKRMSVKYFKVGRFYHRL